MPKGKKMTLDEGTLNEIDADYLAGLSVYAIGDKHDMSPAKAYYVLRDRGCLFRPRGVEIGRKRSAEFCKKLSAAKKGIPASEEQKQKQSEAMKCHYNGLNGYGHTKKHPGGYVACYAPDHPFAHGDGYVMLHRVLMEIHLGRYLTDREVVHHINGARNDNALNNLLLMTRHDHASMHTKIRNQKGGDLYESRHNHR